MMLLDTTLLLKLLKPMKKMNDTNVSVVKTFKSEYVKIDFSINPIQTKTILFCDENLEIINEAILNTIKRKVLISLMITNDKKMIDLNFKWRNIKKTTNVLSFPIKSKLIYDGYLLLGDIAISNNQVQLESKERKIEFKNHFNHLLLHGTLHLLGFDHKTKEEELFMEKLEVEILKKFQISNPYIQSEF